MQPTPRPSRVRAARTGGTRSPLRLGVPALALAVLSGSAGLRAQVPDPVKTAEAPVPGAGHLYLGRGAETVNPADGMPSFKLPVPLPRGRGAPLTFSFNYSGLDQVTLSTLNQTGTSGNYPFDLYWNPSPANSGYQVGGWSYGAPVLAVSMTFPRDYQQPAPGQGNGPPSVWEGFQCDAVGGYTFMGLDGAQHALQIGVSGWDWHATNDENYQPGQPGGCLTPITSGAAEGVSATTAQPNNTPDNPDGYFQYVPAVTVLDASGTQYFFGPMPAGYIDPNVGQNMWEMAASIIDRNGNEVVLSNPAHAESGANSYEDELGRTVVSWTGLGNDGDQVTVSGLNSPFTLHWGTVTTGFPEGVQRLAGSCSLASTASQTFKVVTAIDLPDGQSYQMSYVQQDPSHPNNPTYGQLTKLTYPGGGWVKYYWGLDQRSQALYVPSAVVTYYNNGVPYGANSPICIVEYDQPAVTERQVSYDGSNVALTQTFSYSTTWNSDLHNHAGEWTSKQTTVVTTDNVTGVQTTTTYNYSPVTPLASPFAYSGGGGPAQAPVEAAVYTCPGAMTVCGPSGPPENGLWAQQGASRVLLQNWENVQLLGGQQTVLDDGKTSTTAWCYDNNYQTTEKDEYDFAAYPGGSAPPSSCGSSVGAALLRKTLTTYHSFAGAHIVDAPSAVTVEDGGGNQAAQTLFGYDATSPEASGVINLTAAPGGADRGNVTSITRVVGGGKPNLTTSYEWFDDGQLASMTDPAGNTTTYTYADAWRSGSSPGQTGAYLTEVAYPATGSVQHDEFFTWDCATGELATITDQNGRVTTFNYGDGGDAGTAGADPYMRLSGIVYPDGGQTQAIYNDDPGSVSLEVKKLISGSSWTDAFTYFDGFGHAVTQCANAEQTAWNRVDTSWTGEGAKAAVSYAYGAATCSEANGGQPGDAFAYDALGRETVEKHSDGASLVTSYAGAATEVQDEGNGTSRVARISQTDGLGRLIAVCEVTGATQQGSDASPAACGLDLGGTGFLTSYGYDTLGDLTDVHQGSGLEDRSFAYDELSRLLTATNPESGTIQYNYDSAVAGCGDGGAPADPGDLTCRTDARNITTAYSYDADQRLVGRTYSDGTPGALLSYDQTSAWGAALTNSVGRLSEEQTSDGKTGEIFGYDAMGRTVLNEQCSPLNCGKTPWVMSYSYDLAGDMVAHDGPGPNLAYGYDAARRVVSLTSSYVDGGHVAGILGGAAYNAFGEPTSLSLDNGTITETRGYDVRGRLTSISAGPDGSLYSETIAYAPDGDVSAVSDSVNGDWSYSYDGFNRLATATCSANCPDGTNAQGFQYLYDRYGNRWAQNVTAGAGPAPQATFNAKNQNPAWQYDAAGDVLFDGAHHYQYDAEGRILCVDSTPNCANGSAGYVYDAEGRRVEHTDYWTNNTPQPLETVYDLGGHIAGEYLWQNGWFVHEELYAAGLHLATYSDFMYFDFDDSLGTGRVRVTVSGPGNETCVSLPFGDGLNCRHAGEPIDPVPMHFTGQEHDPLTGLEHFPARYDSSAWGRFMTPDPLNWIAWRRSKPRQFTAFLAGPRNLDEYVYVGDNPMTATDPTGLYNCKGSTAACLKILAAYNLLLKAQQAAQKNSQEYKDISRALKALGKPNDGNGVVVSIIAGTKWRVDTATSGRKTTITVELAGVENGLRGATSIPDEEAGLLAHEGAHAADERSGVPNKTRKDLTGYERRGVTAQAEVARELGYNTIYGTWSRAGGYNHGRISDEISRAVAQDCAQVGATCR